MTRYPVGRRARRRQRITKAAAYAMGASLAGAIGPLAYGAAFPYGAIASALARLLA